MANKFWGDYKGVEPEQLPVFTLTIVVQDLRSGKMAAQSSCHYCEVGSVPSYAKLKKDGAAALRTAIESVKELSEKAEVANA